MYAGDYNGTDEQDGLRTLVNKMVVCKGIMQNPLALRCAFPLLRVEREQCVWPIAMEKMKNKNE